MKKTNLIVGLTAILSIFGCSKENTQDNNNTENSRAIRVKTIVAEKPEVNCTFNYSGIVTPSLSTSLSFQLPGSVVKIHVDEGDQVKKGQILSELDKTSYLSAYQATQAMQKQAQDAYNRLKTVYDKGSLPEIQWEEIKSKLEQAKAAAQIANQNLQNCTILAPSEGTIGSRNIEIGSNVMPGIPVFKLVAINDVFIRISVPENEINKIKIGQTAKIVIPAISSSPNISSVEKIGVMANQISKTYEVKLRMGNSKQIAKPGMACDIELTSSEENKVLTLPSQAVLTDSGNKEYIFLVNKQTHNVSKQFVKVGAFANNSLEILSGLSVGDIVVVNGQHKLKNNDLVIY